MRLHFEKRTPKAGCREYMKNGHRPPEVYPAFVLVQNTGWNDYSWYTWYALWYYPEEGESIHVGDLKLMHRTVMDSYDVLPDAFDSPLGTDFCSLGMNAGYYIGLRERVREKAMIDGVLEYLRDCTADTLILEEFRRTEGFVNSLLRDMDSERAMNEARLLLEVVDPEEIYSFGYYIDGNRGDGAVWNVSLEYYAPDYRRIVGVVGSNGVGKTYMMKGLVKALKDGNGDRFAGRVPLFSFVSVVTSTGEDGYPAKGDRYELHTMEQGKDSIERIILAAHDIERRPLVHRTPLVTHYMETLAVLLGDVAEEMFESDEEECVHVADDRFRYIWKDLSSGQRHLLALVTFVFKGLHLSSLVVIDEPENHLHPDAMVNFMIVLARIMKLFESYAVIVTHSPLIIREIVNRNVFLYQKLEGDVRQVSRVAFDTFGEDVSTLYRRIFHYDENHSYFTELVKRMVRNGKDEDEILASLWADLPANLNARMRIHDIILNLTQEKNAHDH